MHFCQIWSNVKMLNYPAIYEVLITQYLHSILDISALLCVHHFFCAVWELISLRSEKILSYAQKTGSWYLLGFLLKILFSDEHLCGFWERNPSPPPLGKFTPKCPKGWHKNDSNSDVSSRTCYLTSDLLHSKKACWTVLHFSSTPSAFACKQLSGLIPCCVKQ